MSRKYTDISSKENQILQMRKEGQSRKQIAETLGLEQTQIKHWKRKWIYTQTFVQAGSLIDDFIYFYNNERIQRTTKLTPLEKRRQFV